jgi:integrase
MWFLEHISILTAVVPGQLVRYRNQVRDHLSGPIGVTPVDTLDKRAMSGWIQEIQRKGSSAKTIKNVHGLLSAAMKAAAMLGYREDNPCRVFHSRSQPRRTTTYACSPHAGTRLIIDPIPEHYRLLIRLQLATGMRWGEVTALKVSDFDLASATCSVRISRAWRRGGDGKETSVLGPTKTISPTRRSRAADVTEPGERMPGQDAHRR